MFSANFFGFISWHFDVWPVCFLFLTNQFLSCLHKILDTDDEEQPNSFAIVDCVLELIYNAFHWFYLQFFYLGDISFKVGISKCLLRSVNYFHYFFLNIGLFYNILVFAT